MDEMLIISSGEASLDKDIFVGIFSDILDTKTIGECRRECGGISRGRVCHKVSP